MKFIPDGFPQKNIIPINITYSDPVKTGGSFSDPDILTIVYRDLDSETNYVVSILNPTIEIYIVKPEFRSAYTHMRNYTDMNECDVYKVKYRTRWFEVGKILDIESEDVKFSPYVFNIDTPIETVYYIEFLTEYHTDSILDISIGKLDIETDIIQYDGLVNESYGKVPINAVTYINMKTNIVYTLILLKDNLPENDTETRERFIEQCKKVTKENYMVDKCHETFDESYPNMQYNILYYDNELVMLEDLMLLIRDCDNNYIGAWNMPFDVQSILARISILSENPVVSIAGPNSPFKDLNYNFKEDTNPQTHKRKHICNIPIKPKFVDDMIFYAGIRSGFGVKPSLKLNNVAKEELQDEKYDYSEVSDIKHLFYDDLEKFILYNIKDVLLLVSLEEKNNDMTTIYNRMYSYGLLTNEVFVTTKVVWYALLKHMKQIGYVPGINTHKGGSKKKQYNYFDIIKNLSKSVSMNDDMFNIHDYLINPDDLLEDDEEVDEGDGKKEKYQGAFVMNTEHMSPTGIKVMGIENKYIHDDIADMDVGSEYPTSIIIGNMSNETLIGKVFLEDPDDFDIPIPEKFDFKGDEEAKYKLDKSNYMLEVLTEDPINFGTLFLGLPTVEEIIDIIDNEILK